MVAKTPQFTPYYNLRVHKKPLKVLVGLCKRVKTVTAADLLLSRVAEKKFMVATGFKYPVKPAFMLRQLLLESARRVKSKYQVDEVYISQMWVNKGRSRGIRPIPRARGMSSPKYLTSTHLFIQLAPAEGTRSQ